MKWPTKTFFAGTWPNFGAWTPNAPDAAVVWRLLAQHELLGSQKIEDKWALILHGIAVMTPTGSGDGPHST